MSILNVEDSKRRQLLTQKLKNDTLNKNEGLELRNLLAKAKTNAEKSTGGGDVVIAILILLGLVAAFLVVAGKK